MLNEGKNVKGGLNNKPKGNRPPAPPKQNKKDLEKLYVDAIKLIDELEEENKKLRLENLFLQPLYSRRELEEQLKQLKNELEQWKKAYHKIDPASYLMNHLRRMNNEST